MQYSDEWLRLNLYKNKNEENPNPIVNHQSATEPFAYDIHQNMLTTGEVQDEDAINVSIANILLTSFGQLLFEISIGSNTTALLFENVEDSSRAERLLDQIIESIILIETRITVISESAFVQLDSDNNSMDITIPYIIKKTGTSSSFNQNISI